MTRVAYTPPAPEGEIATRIAERRGGRLTPLDRMLLHSPPIADGWNTLLAAVRTQTTVPPDVRELIVLRIATLNDAPYEWTAHEPVARRAGVTDAQLAAVRTNDPAPFTPAQRAALAYTDAMTRRITVPYKVFADLADHFDDRQIVEITATVGTYNLVSRFLVALEITPQASQD